jgi:HEPN domain-containing protein
MRELAPNAEIADSIVGFHAQQALEKWLKAVMAQRLLPQAKTHDLSRLATLLETDGVELPAPRSRLDELTQYSVPLRYEDLLDAEPLDRPRTIALVDTIAHWAIAHLQAE